MNTDWKNALAAGAGFVETTDLFHAAAAARAGADDFGDPSYLTGLNRLLDALDKTPPPNPARMERAGQLIEDALAGRASSVAGWTRYPEVLDRPIVKPLFVIGIPRSGTTALHKMLSMDPAFQGLERWLARAPQPRPPREDWVSYPAFQTALEEVRQRSQSAPDAQTAHSIAAEAVDECLITMSHCFISNWFGSNLDVPDYDTWHRQQDETPAYQYLADALRLIARSDSRSWLLKNPGHVWAIDALLSVFPDARIVQIHRDPALSIPSMVNLIGSIRGADATEKARLADREVKFWAEAAARTDAAQAARPEQFLNIDFDAFGADPMTAACKIYDHFDMQMSEAAETGIAEWVRQNPRSQAPKHDYPLAIGRWDRAEIHSTFAPYLARHFPGLSVG